MTTCDLSVIIVSWNVRTLLTACLRSIDQACRPLTGSGNLRAFGTAEAPATLEVIVVDNGSTDGSVDGLAQQFPWVRLVRSAVNLGFTRANNRGYEASRGAYVYFLNPDTELDHGATRRLSESQLGTAPSPAVDSLWQLFSALRDEETLAVAGPQLRYGNGLFQPSARRFPTPLTGFFESTWLGRAWPANPWARRMHMADWSGTFRHDVDWLVGAALLCRRSALEAVRTSKGPFDERFFMYSEELDLCLRLRRAGWRITYVPEAVVVHHEAQSSEQVSTARHIHFNTSKVQFYAKWFGPVWAELLRRYLLLEFRVQLWVERGKWLLGHKRDLRSERIDAYRQVLESRLSPEHSQP